jgi:serine/arginine repetitive matrix protein 2
VRAAYVAHTVSKLITYRVFGPFLFSLGRRYDKADSLFSSMSHHIRDKSTRKEAIWRQQTLLAAFTSSGAKQRINTAAGTVVEEIVNAVKHFADPREEEGIKIAVKRIVKLAAETWRFARLEREMINATMPALLDEEHQFTGPEYWPPYESYKPEGTLIGSLAGTTPAADEQPQLLLRLFPVIWRESKHENFHTDGEKPDAGCIFHHGLALYDDAEPVVQRMEELKSAGLPSYTTTASPTIAENGKFPPPIVPPPREAPPSPPAPAEPSEQPSVRQTTPPPPPSSIPSLYESTPSMPVKAYRRPPPGPIDFASPRDLIGLPPPIESMKRSHPSTPKKTSEAPTEPRVAPPPPPSAPPPPPPANHSVDEYRQPTPAESAILPTSFPEPSPSEGKSREPPTPPHSRSGTPTERPISPLFEAVDEIEALQSHRSRQSSKSLSRRRSTHSRRSKEEIPEINPTTDTNRRTSGYAISTRSAKTADSERTDRTERTEKTDKTDRTDKSERDPKSRYMCESRSAAVKALYPNSPMAGQSSGSSSKNSVSSSKKKDRDSRELKRERSIPDNGTWDTSSNLTSEATNTQFSIAKKRDRDSRELKRERSIPDNGTWDTSSNLTSEAPNTQLSMN